MPVKEIMDLVRRTMVFKISAKKDQFVNRGTSFPVLIINTDPEFLKIHCNDLLKLKDKEGNSDFPISLGDDFLEGFMSDEEAMYVKESEAPPAGLAAIEVSSKPASISAIEIQHSEYYTCVKNHSPYPKVTHIFGDCILEWHNHELTNSSKKGKKGIELPMAMGTDGFKNRTTYPSSDFLSFCHHCKKELNGEDIYIYRGEKAFCSSSCRSEEISIEKEERTSDDDEVSEKTNFGDEFSQNGLFIAI
nr:FCS-Like Zinc finger 10-like [Ipomoea batatas]